MAQKKQTYFQLEEHITPNDYEEGVMLLRLRHGYRHAFEGSSSRQQTVSTLKQKLGIKSVTPVASAKAIAQSSRKRQGPPRVDLSLMYVVRFNPQVPVEEAINTMYASGMVSYAEPSYIYKPHYVANDPFLDRQYYLALVQALEAWDISRSSEDIVIGIVDSGIDTDHPDLRDKKAINEDEIPDNNIDDDEDGFVDNVWGWDFIGDDINDIQEDNNPNEEDDASHGTLVAGCAAALTDNNAGIAGVGFNAKFVVTKHSYPDDTANSIYAGYLGISYMASQGVDIINLSFGGPGRSQFVQDIIDFAVLDQGCLVVASAGNDGESTDNYPAAYNHVLSVTATDRDDEQTAFSNTSLSVDISAPGTGILTTAAAGKYATVQGTSFSAPIVSGAAALLKTHYPEMTGMQIGEILRVTADESIYDNPQNPQNRLGKGRLNILRALTEQFPSVRIQNSEIVNNLGDIPQEGDTVLISADFINYLWPSSSALTATLSSTDSYVQLLEDEVQLGIISMGDTISNVQTPFRIFISEDTPENTNITLQITYTDGNYTDYEYLTILVNPSYLNIEENRVATSISSRGRIGFQDNSLDSRDEGLGFIFEETNLLFEMGLMLGTSEKQISNAVRTGEGQEADNDFRSLTKISTQQPGLYAYSEVIGRFDDERAGAAQSEVTVDFRTMVWIEEPHNNYVMVQYNIRNDGEDTLQNFYAGLYADWDVGADGSGDRAAWDDEVNLGYVYSAEEEGRLFAGLQELSGNPNYYAIDNDPAVAENSFGVYDDFTDAEKFRSLSGGIARERAGFSSESGNDVSHTVSSGPYALAPGDSVLVAFALHGALSLPELQASAEAALAQYQRIFQIPRPQAEDVVVCYGDAAVLQASQGNAYRWYASKTGGEPLDTGAVFVTPPVTADTSYFVANVTDSAESSRTQVRVKLALNPALQLLGSALLCSNDSLVLAVAEADTYLWSTGDTTQSIVVRQAGSYYVQVSSDSLECAAISDTLSVQTLETPAAVFQIEMADGSVHQHEIVQFTDQSRGEVASWFWDFGDSTSSTEQNPVHVYEQEGDYEVSLLVTNAGGCADSSSQTISVITSVEDPGSQVYLLAPNPASRQTSLIFMQPVAFAAAKLLLLDAQGKTARIWQLTPHRVQEQVQLDLQGLSPGAYILQLVAAEATFTRRLLLSP